jgi:hypothetical protein
MTSSGMLRRVALVRTDVSEELNKSHTGGEGHTQAGISAGMLSYFNQQSRLSFSEECHLLGCYSM